MTGNMAKVQRSDPGKMPPRSESFLRMLELEKQYKMQRIQDSPPTTASLPSPTSASAQPSSAPRARRASGYPPLSHQDQMMKAMNRSSALPSLSVSIPPSPEQDPPSKASDPREEPHPAKEERTKTVTFSNPGEDESDLSDQSSICHSPSWEGWSKKTKRPNKPEPREQQKNKEEKPAKTLKKKGNRLSKAPPPQGPLAVSAVRSQTTSELDPHQKPDKAVINASQPVKQETIAQGQANQKRSSLQGDDKSRGRKFLSGFKLQHGNVTGGKKSTEISQRGAEATQSGRNRSSSVLSFNKSHSAGPGIDVGSMGSHKPSAEASNRSYFSIDKRPPMVRPPSSSSSHGRSQSLLSSTLNKLRGPSYLYHRPQEERGSNSSVRPASRDNASLQAPGRSEDRLSSSGEPTPVATKSSFPRRFRHKATASDTIVSLGPADTSRPLAPRDLDKRHDSPEPKQFLDPRGHRPSTQTSDGESTVRDSREHIERVSEPRGNLHNQDDVRGRHLDSHNTKARVRSTESERRRNTNGQVTSQIQQPAENMDNVDQESVASSQDEDYASAYEHQSDPASGTAQRRGGENRAGAKTSMPAARTSSRERDDSPMTTSRRVEPSPIPSTLGPIGRTVTADLDADSKAVRSGRFSKVERSELQNEGNTQIPAQQIRANKSTDYFTFINESYAPPSLELRSPLENLLQSLSKSERVEKVEIADTLRTRPSRQVAESERPSSSETQAISSKRKTGDKLVNGDKLQDSLATRPQTSELDAPPVERLGASAKPAKTLTGSDAGSTSTKRSQQHEASHSASERSSSSTFGDSPPSPSSMATPDSSRPHSHKGRPPSHLDLSRNGLVVPNSASDEKPKSRRFPLSSRDRSTSSSRPSSKETDAQADNWSRSTLPIDLENYSSITLGGVEGLASSPALVSTPTSMTFADALKEEIAEELNSKSHSALDLPSTNLLPPLKHQFLNPKKNTSKLSVSATSAPDSPISEPLEEPLKPALKKTRNTGSNGQEAPVLVSSGAAYLQEARKTVSNAPIPAPRMLRPQFAHRNTAIGTKGGTASSRTEPMAKMLVECCSCHFFHDMPARVYECMAKPDSFVEDKTLGVSAAITTMVKCPWCGHGMTTQCCSGYAAVVYLKEKLHGK